MNYTTVVTGTNTGGHVVGKYRIVSGTGAYQGATGTGGFEGDWGDKSPLKGASLYNVELDVKTPGTVAAPRAATAGYKYAVTFRFPKKDARLAVVPMRAGGQGG